MLNDLRKLLLATDDGGQLALSDVWTPQSDAAISSGLAEEVRYDGSYTWIRLTEKGRKLKSEIQAG